MLLDKAFYFEKSWEKLPFILQQYQFKSISFRENTCFDSLHTLGIPISALLIAILLLH